MWVKVIVKGSIEWPSWDLGLFTVQCRVRVGYIKSSG